MLAKDGESGTKGLTQAAQYIADEFKAIGLKPAFGDSYFQQFPMGWGFHLGPNNALTYKDMKLDTASGIMPLGFSGTGTVSAPLVFVGYGIIAPEFQYDDFADVKAEGKIILCMTSEPGEFDSTSKFSGLAYTTHSGLRSKAGNAKIKGAVAMLVVEGPRYAGKDKETLSIPRSDEPYIDCGIPAFRITREALKKLYPDFDLDQLQLSIDNNNAPRSMAMMDTSHVTLVADLSRESVTVENVAGVLPGDSTIIVVGAHYDHLGRGQSGSLEEKPGLIHNGADDNASGCAGLIETARMLKEHPVKSTVVFASFTAEEVGLGGSAYMVKHFPLDIKKTRAMVNVDMIGRLVDNKLTVVGCKSATELEDLVKEANKDLNIDIVCKGDGYGPSDLMSFYMEGIPVLFLFTGAHEDYHKSTDDVDKINFPGLAKCTDLTDHLVRQIDNFGKPLTYVKSTEPPQQSGRFRTTLGTIPDFAQPDSVKGVLISGVRDNGPAQKAGMQKGDLMVKLGKVNLNNIYDFVYALKAYAPGDTVEVHYIREGKENITNAVLIAPKVQ